MFASMNAPTPNLSIAEGRGQQQREGVGHREERAEGAKKERRRRRRPPRSILALGAAASAQPSATDGRRLLSGGADAREVEASTQQVVLEHLHPHRDLRPPARPPAALRKHAQSRARMRSRAEEQVVGVQAAQRELAGLGGSARAERWGCGCCAPVDTRACTCRGTAPPESRPARKWRCGTEQRASARS